jgi:hypothetical protein
MGLAQRMVRRDQPVLAHQPIEEWLRRSRWCTAMSVLLASACPFVNAGGRVVTAFSIFRPYSAH